MLDPFAGVCLGALDAMTYGLSWVGCELEPRFHALGLANLAKWRQEYGFTGATVLQGDSRCLRAVLAGAGVQGCIGSPPYEGSLQGDDVRDFSPEKLQEAQAAGTALKRARWGVNSGSTQTLSGKGYGTTPGQLGTMKAGPQGIVSSPPYAGAGALLGTHNGLDYSKSQPGTGTRRTPARNAIGEGGYGTTPGQLGAMPAGVVGSPPFSESLSGKGACPSHRPDGSSFGQGRSIDLATYGTTPGQLGALPAGVVGSPPFQDANPKMNGTQGKGTYAGTDLSQGMNRLKDDYAGWETKENLGNTSGNTFWSAAAQILQELWHLLPPGAPAVWVLKAYVSKGKIVDFPRQWEALCHQCGFETAEWIEASLLSDCGVQETLFGDAEHITVAKKSFFRRLAERKGSPRIDAEIVLITLRGATP